MAVALGLGGVAPDLLGRGRVGGLDRLRGEPEPDLLAVVAEGAAQGVGPGHPIVAAPVGVDHELGGGQGERWVAGAQLVQRLGLGVALGPDRAALAPDGRAVAQQDLAAGGEDLGELGRRHQRQLARAPSPRARRRARRRPARLRVDAGDHGLLPLRPAPRPCAAGRRSRPRSSASLATGSVTCTGIRNLGALPMRQMNSPP